VRIFVADCNSVNDSSMIVVAVQFKIWYHLKAKIGGCSLSPSRDRLAFGSSIDNTGAMLTYMIINTYVDCKQTQRSKMY
jgi:hypothetical protein